MNFRALTAAALGCGLVLTACTGNAEPTVEIVTETVTQTVAAPAPTITDPQQTTEAAVATTEPPAATPATPTDESPADDGESRDPALRDAGAGGREILDLVTRGGTPIDMLDTGRTGVNGYGHLQKEVGQWAATAYEDTATSVFRITEIETNYQCPSPTAEPSANGQFVALTLEIAAAPELATTEVSSLWFSSYDFEIWDRSEAVEEDSIGTQQFCLDGATALPATISPGENATGEIVLDTSVDSGFLILRGDFLGYYGQAWVWEF